MQVVSRYSVQWPGCASVLEVVEIDVALDELASVDCPEIAIVAFLVVDEEPADCAVRWRY